MDTSGRLWEVIVCGGFVAAADWRDSRIIFYLIDHVHLSVEVVTTAAVVLLAHVVVDVLGVIAVSSTVGGVGAHVIVWHKRVVLR